MLTLLLQNNGKVGAVIDGEIDFAVASEPAITFSVTVNEDTDHMLYLRPNSDNDIIVSSTTLESTDATISDATVAATLLDEDGNTVTGGTCACTATSTAGQYRGTLLHTVSITSGAAYIVKVTAAKDSANSEARIPAIGAYYEGE